MPGELAPRTPIDTVTFSNLILIYIRKLWDLHLKVIRYRQAGTDYS